MKTTPQSQFSASDVDKCRSVLVLVTRRGQSGRGAALSWQAGPTATAEAPPESAAGPPDQTSSCGARASCLERPPPSSRWGNSGNHGSSHFSKDCQIY